MSESGMVLQLKHGRGEIYSFCTGFLHPDARSQWTQQRRANQLHPESIAPNIVKRASHKLPDTESMTLRRFLLVDERAPEVLETERGFYALQSPGGLEFQNRSCLPASQQSEQTYPAAQIHDAFSSVLRWRIDLQ